MDTWIHYMGYHCSKPAIWRLFCGRFWINRTRCFFLHVAFDTFPQTGESSVCSGGSTLNAKVSRKDILLVIDIILSSGECESALHSCTLERRIPSNMKSHCRHSCRQFPPKTHIGKPQLIVMPIAQINQFTVVGQPPYLDRWAYYDIYRLVSFHAGFDYSGTCLSQWITYTGIYKSD